MLNTGGWEAVSDALDPAPAPAVPATPPTHITLLEAKSYKELQVLTKRAGLNAGGKKEDLIAALLPLCESGVVSLEELPKLAPDPASLVVTVEQ